MNEDILYQQYLSNNTDSPISIEEFTSLKSIMSPEDFNNFVGVKKKENSQETPSNSLGLEENQPTPTSAQGNPQITSVPISQDLDLIQAQLEAMQGVQNPALDLQQPLANQNGSLESNGVTNTSSSVLEEFNKNIQNGIGEVKDFVQDQITNPSNASLRVLPKKYENQFNNTSTIPQDKVGNVSLPKNSKAFPIPTTFDTNGLQEIPIPNKSITDENGNIFKINNDVVKAYKTPSGQTILQTGVGLIPEEVYLSLKDKEGKQRKPQSKDVYENINGVFVEQDYSEVPIDESVKSYKNYDYISSKDEYGNILSEIPIDTNLFLGLQAKGLGELEFHEDGTPKFKINKDTVYVLDSILLSDINKEISTRNAIRNSAYISSVYEGAELEKNARDNFISRYGQANYDKYGVLPPQVMDRLQYEERVQNYVSQGYTEQEAVQYANTYKERELQGVREENNFILNNIFSKLKSEDSQEKKAWITFAESYPKEFRDFFNEYTEKFGDEAWDNSYLLKRFDNPMRRASIKDEFINYLRTLQVYSQIELKNKTKQAKADVRFGAENKNADLINQGYAKLNNLNVVSKFIQDENTAIATLEDQTKPLFKQAYEKGIENAQLESSANRNELSGVLELGAKKIGNIPVRVIGNLFQSATSFFTGNSDWSKYVNEDIEFSKNAFELNKNAEELRTEVVTYKDKQGNIYKLRDGNIYKVDKNGYEFYKPELDNNSFKANLTEVSRDKEWNGTSVTAQGAQLIAEVYLMNRLGTSSGNLMSKPFGSYAVRIAKELGTESRYYNILKSVYKGIRASENASPFGMAAYTFGGMTKRNNELGYDGLESWFKGIFDAGMMYAANRFFPDARFFKEGDRVQKTAFNLLKNGDKKGALELTKNFFIDASYYTKNSLPDIGGEMFQEMGLEQLFQGVSDVVSGAFKQDKKIWEKAIDPNNFADISIETAVMTALSTGAIKGVQNLKTSPLVSFEGMTDLERVIISTNIAELPDALRFISNDASFAGLQGSKATRRLLEMQTAKKYLDQLPKDNTLTLSQTADVITNLQKLENLKKEQEKATSESVKKQYQEQIDSVEEAIAKTFEESKNNTIVDEQPQQTTQPEQTQETAQGQTTETNLQPEQTTVAGEQGISIDLNAKTGDTLYKPTEQSVTTNIDVEPIGKLGDGSNIYVDTPKYRLNDSVKGGYILNISDVSDSLTPLKSVEFTDLNEAKYVADYFVENAPKGVVSESSLEDFLKWAKEDYQKIKSSLTSETEQTTQQIENQTEELSEEEQIKINLERLNAYIEAKKQREQEQQVQVSPSEEVGNVQQNEVATDAREIQELKNAIQEGESILKSGKNSQGKKLTEGQKESIKKSIDNAKRRLGVQQNETFSGNEQVQNIEQNTDNSKTRKSNGFNLTKTPSLNDVEIILNNDIEVDSFTSTEIEDRIYSNEGSWNKALKKGVENLGNGWYRLLKTVDGNSILYSPTSKDLVLISSKKGGIDAVATYDFVNNNPVLNPQQSETQNAPTVSESKSTNGKYTIRVEQNNGIGTAKILDNSGNEVNLTNKQKEKYVAEHFAKQTYPETVVEDADKLNPREFNQELVKTSNNPIELAQILETESEFIPSELLDAKENAIANVIGNKVSRSSFIQFDDANNITFSIAKGYGLTNKGKTTDVIAQEAEVLLYGDWDSQNPRVTTEDVIDFMKTYNNGADTFFRQPNPIYVDAAGKFEKLTGIKATKNALDVLLGKKTATKVDFAKLQEEADILSAEQAYNLEKEYNEWFNSLSLEDKNLELQKTYPYEQRTEEDTNQSQNESVSNNQTESGKNVANQERNGTATEEVNQVSPSSQYEGAVTYTQFGEQQQGNIYYDNGVAKIKDKAGKVYSANSPVVKNLKDADGNAIQLQKSNERLTPITKQAFDALVTKLQKAFPRFAKVTYDFEAFKKQAEKLGATFNDIQRMVMAFHGSPHSFDKFTTEKIGTGEGAQAFGWGLYFTDIKSIAETYAKQLGKIKLKQQYKGNDVVPQSAIDGAAGILNNTEYKTIKDAITYATKLKEIAITDFPDRVKFWEDVINVLKNSKKSDFKKVESKVLYSVSLHKGKKPSEYTWLEWDKELSNETIRDIFNSLGKEQDNEQANIDYELENYLRFDNSDGRGFYEYLTNQLGSDKEASLFLLRAGIDGIKYPAESISRGATSDNARGFNYVVFDENAVTIEDKIQFMQTPNGTIYGAKLPDGTIYLNPQFLNANTPIHEFSHLFEQLLPSRFKSGVELLKQTNLGKKLFEQLKQEGNYANLTDEQLWGEALNTHIGNFGENEVNNPKGGLKKLQDWIKDFFAKVGDVLGIKKLTPDTQLRMFTEGVVKDLLGGKPIVAEKQVSLSEQVQYSFLTENDYDANGNIKPEVLAEIQAERESIKAEAQANGTFMKAPNGNATNLNEAQWIDVRTKRFKDWFGDWENDAKNASKVVDENGEPLVVYHGTDAKFTEFDKNTQSNKGFWFTPKKNHAEGYSMARNNGELGNVVSAYLNIKNPAKNDWISKSNPESDIVTDDMVMFDEAGYDGWISKINGKVTTLVTLNPNQIKSATANVGTYSANNNDIRFSINSKTPLSVKEQTEVINDLVANGEESAFAKLQETNWYKGLTEEQKQKVTPTNIAETIMTAVNTVNNNLEQKVQRRDAKIEKLQNEKEDIAKTLKDKIKELKSEYKNKINELKNSDKTFKEKFAEKLYWKRQATNAIKLILKDKYIRKNVTDNDIVKLLNLSDRIYRDNDVNVAFDNFEKYLDKVMSKEDEKTRREKEKYDKVYNEVETQFNNGVSLSEIIKSYEKDTDKERAKKAYFEIQGKKITPEQAVEMMDKINEEEQKMLNPKKSINDRLKNVRQKFNQKLLDRQWLPKQLLENVGAMDTFNRLINFGGASSKAKMLFDRAYGKIWFGLGIEDIKTLNNIIQNKRVISIAENRAKRGLEPINNTVSEITINAQGKNMTVKQMMTKDTAQAYLDGVKAKIGEKKFNKLSQRADAYFAEFKTLLDALLDNGMIRQEAYDSMVEIDYQPRVFLEHLLDYDQKLSKEEQEFRNKTNGLTKDLIKMLDNGSEGVLLSNSQLLLASAINSRVQAIAMNNINKKFITKDFPKAKIRFEGIDPKNFKNAEERRFYKYFKELESKVIIPNGNTIDAKQGYSKAYYFENGVRKEFLLEDELHGLWHDKVRGLSPDIKQKLSYATGSSILKGMATGYNPAFIIVNTPRDFLHTLSFSPEYRGVVLWEGALLATDFARATAPFVGSIYKFNKGKDNVVRKYFEYGGGMDFLNQQGLAERDNLLRRGYQRLLKYLPQMVQDKMSADAAGEFLKTIALRPLSNYSELGFRIANFTRALENQLSDYNKDNKTKYKTIDEIPDKEIVDNMYNYAVTSTRGLLDFNQGGTFVKDAESVLPYINAGVQGTRAAVQAFRKDPIGVSTQVAQIVTMTSVTFFGIGLYFMGVIRPDDEDENKETLINNYLDFRESLTPEQKKNYFTLPVGYNKADKSYEVLLIAKSQPLTPLFILSEEVSENILKRQVGKKEKPIEDIISSMGRAFSDNIDPTSLSTLITGNGRTFAENVKTTAGKLASRNPVFKGVATSLSGYDFYFNQPLQDTQSGKLTKFEGQSSNRVEQFYKDFGLASDFSPVRTKAFIESIVTSPTTNPYLGLFYAGSDAMFTDVTIREAVKDFLGYNKQKGKWMFRETPVINRAIKETSDFSRQLNKLDESVKDDKYVKALEETEYMRMESDKIVSEYVDKAKNAQYQDEADAFVRQGLEASLEYVQDKYKDDPIRGKQFMDRAINKLRNYDTIGTVWDIKYRAENNPEAQAILIYSYFGDIQQNEDSERIMRSLKTAGLTSSSIMSYYQKILEENNK